MCSTGTKEALLKLAKREKRTLSNLIERIVDDALANDQVSLEGKATKNISGDPGGLALTFLNKIFSGKPPTDIERESLANSLGIDLSKVDALVDRVLTESK
ncbi:hypothetical protein G7B40_031080 [Aetokthonos hydrillicola Thurmond2011]|uniref:Uncharacterized protein n=1 Tax=Aetokthonos hydrillicola Thurmond2011 TaxID=2712845 RepID=A0AAP5MD88_9CYAN|nr:hypothetical protein [Aetokthonos hydrillicola]MBW4589715.1 hypothetical protein [Aetokthonos hydrillicola CCALA 1050]MDR9898969.1 hypothetical protein [Aetokthonos hydrillicola Thurmond2011]